MLTDMLHIILIVVALFLLLLIIIALVVSYLLYRSHRKKDKKSGMHIHNIIQSYIIFITHNKFSFLSILGFLTDKCLMNVSEPALL